MKIKKDGVTCTPACVTLCAWRSEKRRMPGQPAAMAANPRSVMLPLD